MSITSWRWVNINDPQFHSLHMEEDNLPVRVLRAIIEENPDVRIEIPVEVDPGLGKRLLVRLLPQDACDILESAEKNGVETVTVYRLFGSILLGGSTVTLCSLCGERKPVG